MPHNGTDVGCRSYRPFVVFPAGSNAGFKVGFRAGSVVRLCVGLLTRVCLVS